MEQFHRAKRYLTKLQYAYEGIQEATAIFSIEGPTDDCISFFMHCYHIKDWIKVIYCKNKNERDEVETFINEHHELQICADLCNGSKHYKLSGNFRSGNSQLIKVTKHKPITYMTGTGSIDVHQCQFAVTSSTETIDALKLANRCIELWTDYLNRMLRGIKC